MLGNHKEDTMPVLHTLFALNSQGFDMLNSTNIVLHPKKIRMPQGSLILEPSASYTALQKFSPNCWLTDYPPS
jgi:hypothetical protein